MPGVGIEPTRAFWALRILSANPDFFAIFSFQRLSELPPRFATFRLTMGARNTWSRVGTGTKKGQKRDSYSRSDPLKQKLDPMFGHIYR